ncbi:hypothetical protein L7F22_043000 [Adiantum nelumboides]|nr:hypothetical protein [Adiantum nelumboides]
MLVSHHAIKRFDRGGGGREMGSGPSMVQLPVLKARGEVHNNVPGSWRSSDVEGGRLPLLLENVSYITHPNSQTGWIVNAQTLEHHMLVLRFHDPQGQHVRFILADKVAAPPEQAGIRILCYATLEHLLLANGLAGTPLTLCKQIQNCLPAALCVRRVEAILADHDPSFHVLSSNCQHYAQDMWFRLASELQL